MDNQVASFFNRTFENSINKKMLFYDFIFPKAEVLDYIVSIVNIQIPDFLDYIYSDKESISITAKDVFQFSNLEDATINLCRKLCEIDNPGISFIDAGKLF